MLADIIQGDITTAGRKILTSGALIAGLGAGTPAVADEIADFYRGKLMTMLISSNVGGDQLISLVTRISAVPEEVFQRARNAIGRKGIKVKLASYTATITKVRKKGRRMGLALKLADGRKGSARVHGRRSKITIAGKKAKPDALKEGMSCQFASATAGGVAFKIACK